MKTSNSKEDKWKRGLGEHQDETKKNHKQSNQNDGTKKKKKSPTELVENIKIENFGMAPDDDDTNFPHTFLR